MSCPSSFANALNNAIEAVDVLCKTLSLELGINPLTIYRARYGFSRLRKSTAKKAVAFLIHHINTHIRHKKAEIEELHKIGACLIESYKSEYGEEECKHV